MKNEYVCSLRELKAAQNKNRARKEALRCRMLRHAQEIKREFSFLRLLADAVSETSLLEKLCKYAKSRGWV